MESDKLIFKKKCPHFDFERELTFPGCDLTSPENGPGPSGTEPVASTVSKLSQHEEWVLDCLDRAACAEVDQHTDSLGD